ncbi:hypothetical protein Taro_029183, partial [Colocasia esculenta]|nr:hypothetical protein [Colocasia esculenta]
LTHHSQSRTQPGSAVQRPETTESRNPSHVCTLQTLSLTSGPRPVFPPTPDLAVEKGLHGDRLKTTTRSTHRTESHSASWLTSGGQPHASHLDGVAPTPRKHNRNGHAVTQRAYNRRNTLNTWNSVQPTDSPVSLKHNASTGRDTLYTWRTVLTSGHRMLTPQTTEEGKAQLAGNSPEGKRQHRLSLTRK